MWTEEGTKAGQQSMETPRTDQLGLLLILSRWEEDSSRTETGGDAMQKVAGGCVDPLPPCAPPGGNIGYQLPTILHQKQEAKGTLTKKGRRKKTLPPSCPYRHGGMEGGEETRKKWEGTFLCFFSFLLFGMRENWEEKRRKKIKTASDSYPRKEGRKRRNQWAR